LSPFLSSMKEVALSRTSSGSIPFQMPCFTTDEQVRGIEASDVKRMKELEEENARLKRMYANLAMDNKILRDLFTKKAEPCHQKAINRGDRL
jgi:hypothetical protein